MKTVLIVDDERMTREGLQRALKGKYRVLLAENGAQALEALAGNAVDVMLSDVRMPGMDGVALVRQVQETYPAVIGILLTAYGTVETAVEAMKAGAADFLTKPVNLDHLELVLARALKRHAVEEENKSLHQQLDAKYGMENILGNSAAMAPVFDVIRQAAPTQASILIHGASGTGKELVAHAIHRLSPRSQHPFVAVHCAALSATLLESELFGHEAGAFTGATGRRKGRFEMAHGGTLFLDEISEIDPVIQVKLLRVLEMRQFERVGGTETLDVDIRLIAATNRDLRQSVAAGKFREDLFYRLDVVSIALPPLCQRTEDIPELAMHFLKEFSAKNAKPINTISPEAMAFLQRYPWPGNVRELRNT
ncbi:MAG: sigma-54 dependent transcriptional regulator, partial [Kiritimatiellaeota bacterium]|nr:sigma-54 dependent transcriptional regulator [Kiritimatiellota bacterium]